MSLPVFGRFPATRMRRNRNGDAVRNLVRENRLNICDLIWPVFVVEGSGQKQPVESMPGVVRYSIDTLVTAVSQAYALGIQAVAIFPYIETGLKTPDAALATDQNNLVCRAVRAVREKLPGIAIVCDVALDPFNSDGHDGLVKDGEILNDETIKVLCEQAVVQARAGCDIIAPSDMMDGRIGEIRKALDAQDFTHVKIMSYAAKYASCFYGPFRDAVGSGGLLKGDKKTYQMDPANSDEALHEVALDINEGADMVMVKPGMPYLDVLARVKHTFKKPTFAYQVSGEYAMLKQAANMGWIDNDKAVLESLTCFKRAGADGILTYFAIEAANLLKQN